MVRNVPEQDLDVVVFGATGVTGRRVCRYLDKRAPQVNATWGAAARDASKLKRILGEEGVEPENAISADLGDPQSLADMASRAKVVLNLVGPYTKYGRPVIKACVENGAHYADLTGEIPFVRQMIDEFDEKAAEAGVKIVEVSGFEALPADLAVALAAETAKERWDERLADVDLTVSVKQPPGLPRPGDILSGGTLQSMAEITGHEDASRMSDSAALITDPARASRVRERSPISVRVRRSNGDVIAPMSPAAFINPAVIQRTAALSETDPAAEPFRYREGMALGGHPATLPFRYAAAGVLAGTQAGLAAATRANADVRQRVAGVMRKVMPESGFGPTGDKLEQWKWWMTVRALSTSGNQVRVELDADGQPGYYTTATMLGEAGLLMADDGATPDRAGCITPAIALGTGSIDRFDHAQLRISVVD
jgi:short subunit dehydrogenase-like uncharacterized protein